MAGPGSRSGRAAALGLDACVVAVHPERAFPVSDGCQQIVTDDQRM